MKAGTRKKKMYIRLLIIGSRIVRRIVFISLRIRGYTGINSNCVIEHGVIFDKVNPKGIIIKERVKIASGTKLISHEDVLIYKDNAVVVEEDAYIGVGCIILPGVVVGRGSVIGSGSVVRSSTPPYSIVIGNPAKIIGFRLTPDEILEHERNLYHEKDRLPIDLLEKNNNKYFINRIKNIKEFTKL